MTQYEQVETLKRFSQGQVKLLVTTSVGEEGIDIAECNLTIRYNHVGNEVTTVQTRGTKALHPSVWNLAADIRGIVYISHSTVLF